MIRIRRFEEQVWSEYIKPRYRRDGGYGFPIGGFACLCSGQEAIPVGACESFQRGPDTFVGTFRGHGWALALGTSMREIMAELFAKAAGCSGGRGGSQHLYDKRAGNLGTHYIAGAQVPLGIGAAFAMKYRRTGGVSFIVMGDGAWGQGVVGESLNLAALHALPAIFIVENNGMACGTQIERHSAETDLARRAASFGISSQTIDGNDAAVVAQAVGAAASRARAGGGPTCLVASTVRLRGFTMSDAMKYRSRAEARAAAENEPIVRLTNEMVSKGQISAELVARLWKDADAETCDAVEFASRTADPALDSRFDHIYAD